MLCDILPRHSQRGRSLPLDIVTSVCPHDCPSACALEVERVDERRIGRVRGATAQPYTRGVVCAKVARYAERQHHPARLSQALRRIGEKGIGEAAFAPISWDDALDDVAEEMTRAAQRHGSETVWPYYYAGTMGLAQRDGINRLRHVMRYSREHLSICSMLSDAGWLAGVGAKRGVDGREIAKSDLIVVWGGNPVSTQVNVMTHVAAARKERGARLVVIDPYRTATAEQADIHLAPLPGTDGALACAVMQVLFKEGYADRDYMARYADDPGGSRPIWPHATRPGQRGSPGSPKTRSSVSRGSTGAASAVTFVSATAFRGRATAPRSCSRSPACRR